MIKKYNSVEEAFLDRSDKYRFALVYMMSEVRLCDMTELGSIGYDEVNEARLFDENGETHICMEDGEITAYIFSDDDLKKFESDTETIALNKEFQKKYGKLNIKRYYSFDEDGQIYTALTRCCGAEEA